MNVSQHSRQAITNIISAKLRSLLAVLGILVGTASVVTLVTSGELATQKALDQFKNLGTDLLSLSLFAKQSGQHDSSVDTLSIQQWWQLKDANHEIIDIAPYSVFYKNLSFSGHRLKGVIIGADESLSSVMNVTLKRGHFVSYLEKYEHFCVIGKKIADQITQYTLEDPVGKKIWLGKQVYTVIGIADVWSENAFFNGDINAAVIIPLRGTSIVSKNARINNAVLRLAPNAENKIEPLITKIKLFLTQNAPDLNLFTRSAQQIIKSMQSQGKIFTLLLGLIGGISLLVGGIGVMNVMLVSVTERRREIGIRKAIGAKKSDIQCLFLIESVVLSLFGGFLGVIFGMLASYIIAYFSRWHFQLFILPPLIGFAVSVMAGIFFGFYPAYRASRLDPIETLRHE